MEDRASVSLGVRPDAFDLGRDQRRLVGKFQGDFDYLLNWLRLSGLRPPGAFGTLPDVIDSYVLRSSGEGRNQFKEQGVIGPIKMIVSQTLVIHFVQSVSVGIDLRAENGRSRGEK